MRSASWLARLAIVAWLTVMWVLLWGELTFQNVLIGFVLGAALMVVFPPRYTNDDPIVIRPLKASWFVIWFLWQLIITNIAVAKEVVLPGGRSTIRTAVVAVQLQTGSGRLATIIANAITLTPGTMTLDARNRPATLYVHVLSFESVEATRDEVADLERRVVGAFGTAEEVARICVEPGAVQTEEVGVVIVAAALVLLSIGGAGFLYRLMSGPTLADRIVALDGILTIVVTGFAAWGAYTDRATYLTVGVVVALVAFLGTSAFARFIEERSR